jgi:glycosyltransferase involved in cell wall biosynthesis
MRLEKLRVSALHVHFGLSAGVVGLLTRELGGPPWSVTIHGPEEFAPENRKRLPRFAASAGAMVVISQWARSALQDSARPLDVEPRIIGMGVGASFLQPTEPIDRDSPVLCVARLDARKGHAVLLEALSQLDNRQRVRVELIGDGPLRPEIEADILRRGLDGSVVLRGWLGERESGGALDRCRFAVLPSLDEALPVAIMESFARARPVIATRVAGVSELVTPGESGILVPPNDPASLAQGLRELLTLPTVELDRLGQNGRRIVEERYDAASNARALIATWRDISGG